MPREGANRETGWASYSPGRFLSLVASLLVPQIGGTEEDRTVEREQGTTGVAGHRGGFFSTSTLMMG